jgi:glycosyltransferase involved in cell wall biosynthesis
LKISAFLISRNEEKIISKAIKSLFWADEIIVVDGDSTDGTVKVSTDLGAKVIEAKGAQARNLMECRNIALKNCQYPWIFFLDADEICSPELIAWIQKFKNEGEEAAFGETLDSSSEHPLDTLKSDRPKSNRIDMYEIRRLEHFKGRLYRFGAGNPSHQWRLFRNSEGVHFTSLAHEYPVFDGVIRRLEKPILHYPTVGIEGMMFKVNRASSFDAQEYFEEGVVHYAPYMFFSGLAQFLKSYFHKQGFRDGVLGFILSVLDGGYFFLRQAKLYAKNKEAGRV